MSSAASRYRMKAVTLSVVVLALAVSTQTTRAATLRVGYGGARSLGAAQADFVRIEGQFTQGLGKLAQVELVDDPRTKTLLVARRDSALAGEVGCLKAVAGERALQAVVYLSAFADGDATGPEATGPRVRAVVLHTVDSGLPVLPTTSFALSDPQAAHKLVVAVCSLLPPVGIVTGVIRTGGEVVVQLHFEDSMRQRVREGAAYELHRALPTDGLKLTSPGGAPQPMKLRLAAARLGTVRVTDTQQDGWVSATPQRETFPLPLGTLVMAAPADLGAFGGEAQGTIVLSNPPEADCRIAGSFVGVTPVLVCQDADGSDGSVSLQKQGHEELTARLPLGAGLTYWRGQLTQIPPFGTLAITTVPAGAKVSIDGVARGNTPLSIPQVPAGERRLELTLAEHGKYRAAITVRVREETEVAVALTRTARSVSISSEPTGAEVRLGEKILGRTPLEGVSIPFGRQKLEFFLANHEPAELVVELTDEGTAEPLLVRLTPAPGSLALVSTPGGARVELDGRNVGSTPLKLLRVSAGSHVLRLSKSGHLTEERTVEVLPGQLVRQTIQLQQLTGLLTVTSLPEGADVLFDGVRLGQTTLDRQEVAVGKHTVLIRKRGFQTWRHEVSILADELTEVSVALVEGDDPPSPPPSAIREPVGEPALTALLTSVANDTPVELRATLKYDAAAGCAICSLDLSTEFPEDTRTIATDELAAIVIPGFAAGEDRRKAEITTGPISELQIGSQSTQQDKVRIEIGLVCQAEVQFKFVRAGRLDVVIRPVHANGHTYTNKRLAFTFDDFPFHDSDRLLDCLQELGVTATLFTVGNKVAKYRETVRRAALAGHRVENHSYAHDNLARLSADELSADLRRCSMAIEEVVGYSPELMRPPGGRFISSHNSVLRELGLTKCGWTLNTADYKYQDADIIARAILRGAQPGAVILLHDGIPATLQALRRVVPILRGRGYSFVAVQELSAQTPVQVVQSP